MEPKLFSVAELSFEELENVIERGLQTFYQVGQALTKIRDAGYYKDVLGYATFEDYCKGRWEFTRCRAYQLIDAFEVVDGLSTIVDKVPVTESQARELSVFDKEIQPVIWQQVLNKAQEAGTTITAKMIKETAAEFVDKIANQIMEDEYTLGVKTYLQGTVGKKFLRVCEDRIEKPAVIAREIITDALKDKKYAVFSI